MKLKYDSRVILYLRLSQEPEIKEQAKRKPIKMLINEKVKKLYERPKNYLNLHDGKELPLFKNHEVIYQRSADGDRDYLKRCIRFYDELHLQAFGLLLKEEEIPQHLQECLEKYRPDILVITGHDSFNHKSKDRTNLEDYQNSKHFKEAVLCARNYEDNHEKLIIIAGACQSNYEELIQAGANFASSPKRINIHALDPAILAAAISLSPKNKELNLLELLSKTKYGSDGMGGIITNGSMYVGYPR